MGIEAESSVHSGRVAYGVGVVYDCVCVGCVSTITYPDYAVLPSGTTLVASGRTLSAVDLLR